MSVRVILTLAFVVLALAFAQRVQAQASVVQMGAPAQVPAGNCSQGQVDYVALGFGASVIAGSATNLTSVTVSNTGTAQPADWVRIRLVREVTINTTVDGTDLILATVNSTTFPITFTGFSNPIPLATGAAVYLLAVDVAGAGTSTVGRTFTLNVTAAVATAAIVQGLPINGNAQTIIAPSLCEIDVQRAATSIATGGTDNVGNRATGTPFTLVYTILNTGSANLVLTGTPLINIPAISITNCSAATTGTPPTTPIAAAGSTTFSIQVTPTSAAPFGFGIRIDNNDADENPYNIIVSGTGVTPAPEMDVLRGATPVATPGTDNVGSAFTAGTAASLVYTIQNNGTANLTLTNPASLTALSNCNVTISVTPSTPVAAAGSTSTTLSVTPLAAGAFSFSYSLANNDSNENPYAFNVSGTASAAAAPEMDVLRGATAIADGLVSDALGTVAAATPQTVTYTIANTGTATLNLTGGGSLVVAAPVSNITSATITTPPSASVTAAGQTTFIVTYTVTAAGAFSFTLSIANDDASENPYNWTVSGTGAVGVPELDVSRGATPVASGGTDTLASATSGTGNPVSYTLANNGTAVLNISAAGATAGTNCTVSVTTAAPATVAAAGSAPFVVSVTPLAAGPFDFTVTILNDDPNEGTYSFTVSGTASIGGGGGGGGGGSDSGGCSSGEGNAWWMLLAALPAIVWLRRRRLATRQA